LSAPLEQLIGIDLMRQRNPRDRGARLKGPLHPFTLELGRKPPRAQGIHRRHAHCEASIDARHCKPMQTAAIRGEVG
jgi:hypothetical protein